MSTSFGVPSSKLQEARENFPSISIKEFFNPRGPWVLVPNGSLLGFFDWVPEHLRVGPWSPTALPTLIAVLALVIYGHALAFDENNDYCVSGDGQIGGSGCDNSITNEVTSITRQNDNSIKSTHPYETKDDSWMNSSTYPDFHSYSSGSIYWFYNVIAFTYMSGILYYSMVHRSKGIVVTYTILSWILNTTRHGINAIMPFLPNDNYNILTTTFLRVNHILRFPALVTASFTFFIWNFILFPYIYFWGFDTVEGKHNFFKWNLSFRMSQFHVCNIIYAILNTMITDRKQDLGPLLFDKKDLWYALVYFLFYGLFLTLVLDRFGVHLYPVFSPRSNYVSVIWSAAFIGYCGFHRLWNHIMSCGVGTSTGNDSDSTSLMCWGGYILNVYTLLGLNFTIMGTTALITQLSLRRRRSKKDEGYVEVSVNDR